MASSPSRQPHRRMVTHFTPLTMWMLFTRVFMAVESQLQPETPQISLMSLLAATSQNTQSVSAEQKGRNLSLAFLLFISCQEREGKVLWKKIITYRFYSNGYKGTRDPRFNTQFRSCDPRPDPTFSVSCYSPYSPYRHM